MPELAAGKITYVEGKNGKAATFKKGTYLEVADNTSLDFDRRIFRDSMA